MQVNGFSSIKNIANTDDVKLQGEMFPEIGKIFTTEKKEWEIDSVGKDTKTGYDKPEAKKAAGLFLDEKNNGLTAEERKTQMTLLADETTDEDLKGLKNEGYGLDNTDSRVSTTVVEKIQAKLTAMGKDLGQGEVSADAIEQAAGSEVMAYAIKQAMSEFNDIKAPDDNAIAYMIKNDVKPTIHEMYMAEHSVFATKKVAEGEDFSNESAIKEQIDKVIIGSGQNPNEESYARVNMLMENDLPVTSGNLNYIKELQEIDVAAISENITKIINNGIASGINPKDIMLVDGYDAKSVSKKTLETVNMATDRDIAYLVSEDAEITAEHLSEVKALDKSGLIDEAKIDSVIEESYSTFIQAKRVLEETRLIMTEEANISLVKRGVHIDTTELKTVVEELKAKEENYFKNLFVDNNEVSDTSLDTKINLYKETISGVEEIKSAPMYVLGTTAMDAPSVISIRDEARVISADLEKAGMAYETLMTEVRPDLGDNIKKAFGNVDDILNDLGLDTTVENERAVRILGYNSTEITEENISVIKASDELVQRTFSNLTPAVVRELIKQNVNPMTMNLAELNEKAEAVKESIGDDSNERFSRFLYKLDKNGEITEAERETFIGIYRLINQVEKTDGSVIGALVEAGRELSFSNLLSAMRSEKHGKMDYSVDDDFAGVENSLTNGIDKQIETAYQMNLVKDIAETVSPQIMKTVSKKEDLMTLSPEKMKSMMVEASNDESVLAEESDYESHEMEGLRQRLDIAKNSEVEVYRLLENFGISNTVDNVIAMNVLSSNRGQIFKQLFKYEEDFSPEDVDFEGIKADLLEKIADSLSTPEDMAKAQKVLADRAEHAMDNMLPSDENITELDIKALKLVNRELSIASDMSKDETYTIPVMVGDELTGLTLKLVHGTEKRGFIDLLFETSELGKIAISAHANQDGVTGLFASDNEETIERIRESDIFENINMSYTHSPNLNLTKMFANLSEVRSKEDDATDEKEGYVSTKELYSMAKDILESIKKI